VVKFRPAAGLRTTFGGRYILSLTWLGFPVLAV
jgi:hypothetical protein